MDQPNAEQQELENEQQFEWVQSWKASLPIKITSIVLWGIALIGFAISVIIYTLSKIYNRPRLHQHPGFLKFKENVLKELREAQSLLHSNDVKGYHRKVKRVFQIISAFEKKFGMYMREAILQSKIKRGGRIVEHGISV